MELNLLSIKAKYWIKKHSGLTAKNGAVVLRVWLYGVLNIWDYNTQQSVC